MSSRTSTMLAFELDHAQTRDAVFSQLDKVSLKEAFTAAGQSVIEVQTDATNREIYLRRPDFGRRLGADSTKLLTEFAHRRDDLSLIIGDGLSATAANLHALPTIMAFLSQLKGRDFSVGPIILAEGARVALGDQIGETLGAQAVVVFIGERPGLSSHDSLGIYLTYAPKLTSTDSDRNCISNVRTNGLQPLAAAKQLAWLVESAFTRKLSGIRLKDESEKPRALIPER